MLLWWKNPNPIPELVILLLFISLPLQAGEFPVGAGAGGMGDAYIALADDALSVFHNPAGISYIPGIASDVCWGMEGFPLVENWSILYAKYSRPEEQFGFGIIHQIRELNDTVYRSYQFILPANRPLSENFTTGFNLKLLTQKEGNSEFVYKYSMDTGFIYHFNPVKLAIVYRNFIHPDMFSFPANIISGLGFDLNIIRFEIDLIMAERLNLESEDYRLGLEINPLPFLSLRWGRINEDSQKLMTCGGGFGTKDRRIKLEYCMRKELNGDSDFSHWLSYSYNLR